MIRICTPAQWPQGLGKGFASFGFWGGDLGRYAYNWLRTFAEPLLQLRFPMRLAAWVFRFQSLQGLFPAHQLQGYVPSLGYGWAWGTAGLGSTHDDHHGCTFRFRPLLWGLSGSRRGVSSSPSRFRSGFSWGGCQAPRQP